MTPGFGNYNAIFSLTPAEILLFNPISGTLPVFRTRQDAELTIGIYKRTPILRGRSEDENPWGLSFMQGLFNITDDLHLFRTEEDLTQDGWHLTGNIFTRGARRMLPLYEAKMIHLFDHRWASFIDGQIKISGNEKRDPWLTGLPRYWVEETKVTEQLDRHGWQKDWLFGWRNICRSTDERTTICSVLPRVGVGNSFPLALPRSYHPACLYANLASFALDYVTRQKTPGTNLTYGYFSQLAVLRPDKYSEFPTWDPERNLFEWVELRVLELTYTACDLSPFAQDLGDDGPPFRWDEERRFAMRAELDAAFFHLYGINRDDVDYIMETFPIVKRKDIQQYGTFRTKDLILQIYDAMTEATRIGVSYQTLLNPPPGRGHRHPAR